MSPPRDVGPCKKENRRDNYLGDTEKGYVKAKKAPTTVSSLKPNGRYGEIALSANEVEYWKRQDEERRRKKRLQRVRKHERNVSNVITKRYRDNLQALRKKKRSEAEQRHLEQKEVLLTDLIHKYQTSLANVGSAHRQAGQKRSELSAQAQKERQKWTYNDEVVGKERYDLASLDEKQQERMRNAWKKEIETNMRRVKQLSERQRMHAHQRAKRQDDLDTMQEQARLEALKRHERTMKEEVHSMPRREAPDVSAYRFSRMHSESRPSDLPSRTKEVKVVRHIGAKRNAASEAEQLTTELDQQREQQRLEEEERTMTAEERGSRARRHVESEREGAKVMAWLAEQDRAERQQQTSAYGIHSFGRDERRSSRGESEFERAFEITSADGQLSELSVVEEESKCSSAEGVSKIDVKTSVDRSPLNVDASASPMVLNEEERIDDSRVISEGESVVQLSPSTPPKEVIDPAMRRWMDEVRDLEQILREQEEREMGKLSAGLVEEKPPHPEERDKADDALDEELSSGKSSLSSFKRSVVSAHEVEEERQPASSSGPYSESKASSKSSYSQRSQLSQEQDAQVDEASDANVPMAVSKGNDTPQSSRQDPTSPMPQLHSPPLYEQGETDELHQSAPLSSNASNKSSISQKLSTRLPSSTSQKLGSKVPSSLSQQSIHQLPMETSNAASDHFSSAALSSHSSATDDDVIPRLPSRFGHFATPELSLSDLSREGDDDAKEESTKASGSFQQHSIPSAFASSSASHDILSNFQEQHASGSNLNQPEELNESGVTTDGLAPDYAGLSYVRQMDHHNYPGPTYSSSSASSKQYSLPHSEHGTTINAGQEPDVSTEGRVAALVPMFPGYHSDIKLSHHSDEQVLEKSNEQLSASSSHAGESLRSDSQDSKKSLASSSASSDSMVSVMTGMQQLSLAPSRAPSKMEASYSQHSIHKSTQNAGESQESAFQSSQYSLRRSGVSADSRVLASSSSSNEPTHEQILSLMAQVTNGHPLHYRVPPRAFGTQDMTKPPLPVPWAEESSSSEEIEQTIQGNVSQLDVEERAEGSEGKSSRSMSSSSSSPKSNSQHSSSHPAADSSRGRRCSSSSSASERKDQVKYPFLPSQPFTPMDMSQPPAPAFHFQTRIPRQQDLSSSSSSQSRQEESVASSSQGQSESSEEMPANLADAFRQRHPHFRRRVEENRRRQEQKRQETNARAMKLSAQSKEEPSDSDPTLVERLATGKRARMSEKEMKERTSRLYHQLPEVVEQRRQEDVMRRRRERLNQMKEQEKARRLQQRARRDAQR